ncbi:Zn-ribbon domain-containing OB-fold protein [Sphingopyxis sp. R3-92]|uniref:Zn-ribbon domain-containing OB-fold protein n=1 Tax=Sphingopyxis sp. R3-92 TaxID=3158553 RepID=UPI003EE767F2
MTEDDLPTGGEERYWRALAAGRLELPRCAGCDSWHWPAVWRCGTCGSWDHRWSQHLLAGTVFSWTRTWHRFAGTEAFPSPFAPVVVALASAPVRLVGVIEGDEDGLTIDAPVTGRIVDGAFGARRIPAIRWTLAS